MATVAFGGTTIWNDSSTGVGLVQRYKEGRRTRWLIESMPGDLGKIAKNVGQDPGRVTVGLTYFMSETGRATIEGYLDGKIGTYGALVIASGGTETISNCILLSRSDAREQALRLPSGTVVRAWQYFLTFEVLA